MRQEPAEPLRCRETISGGFDYSASTEGQQQTSGNMVFAMDKTNRYASFTLMLLIFTLCLFWSIQASAQDKLKHSESRGGLLYAMHCNSCHTSEVHWRKQKLATDLNSLKAQVRRWQTNIRLVWSEEEVIDVANYLNAVYYDFPVDEELSQDKKINQVLRQH